MNRVVMQTDLPGVKLLKRGKVRDIYDLGDQLLIVASDRISAFDVVMPNGIPDKGKILTQLSRFWFEQTADIILNHFISTDMEDFPANIQPYREQLEGRSMLVCKAEPLPVECVVRGYLAGSGWKEYQQHGTICGVTLPPGLPEYGRLEEPIFTPATKATTGHDENITVEKMKNLIGTQLTEKIIEVSLAIYQRAHNYAEAKGIIIADTKFEFGIYDDQLILIDELLTPDSSRFWPLDDYEPGTTPPSFDKQYLRDYLTEIGWDKSPPAPQLPETVVKQTRTKYLEALKRLTGRELNEEEA
ncbi:phosphoribosylaminoimidazolesuccinocarboxamide synthase [candidate division KSB1 bacterium]|nr:MAG: phosphoribosylaminoimidazolesuccinocarboxamide synthase [candidate division KSB1 bacterium]